MSADAPRKHRDRSGMATDGTRPADPADTPGAPGPAGRAGAIVPVSLLVSSARLLLERHLGLLWVSGEVSGYVRAASGHQYFTLKDASAQVRCVFFRHKAQGLAVALRDGLAVEVRATPTIYDARGDFQLAIETVRLSGPGVLYERYLQVKAALEAAGWFDPDRKRALPRFPRRVGVVTSLHAAALRDVLTTLARRNASVSVVVYPAPVQGMGAANELAEAIRTANARNEVDLLIVCRGGGSLEDLWAFNEQSLARAVFESALPVISGVGHETDFTICDFIADARAATPTAAATQAVPDRAVLRAALAQLERSLARAWTHGAGNRAQRLDLAARHLTHPAARLALQRETVQKLGLRLARAGRVQLERCSAQLQRATDALAHLNPAAVLERGYAIARRAGGGIVTDSRTLAAGDTLGLTFARGQAEARVTSTGAPPPE